MVATLKSADWKAVSFVSSTTAISLRCMHENGRNLRIEAQAALARYPSAFKAWKAVQSATTTVFLAAQ
jgi:hypothetical protein